MVPAKASGFLSERETGDRAARQLWPDPLCIAPPSGGPLSSLASRGSWEPMTLVQGLASLQNLCGGLLEGFSLGM